MNIPSTGAWTPAVASVAGATPTSMASPPPSPHMHGTLDGIAGALGMTPDAMRSALAQGSSVTDLAQQKGVSRADLVASAEKQIQQTRQAKGQAPLDQTVMDRMVNRAFDRHRGGSRADAAATPAVPSTMFAVGGAPATGFGTSAVDVTA